jgi:hypothetical protein
MITETKINKKDKNWNYKTKMKQNRKKYKNKILLVFLTEILINSIEKNPSGCPKSKPIYIKYWI